MINEVQPPSHGLYLLGTVEKDGIFKSIEAYGTTQTNCRTNTRHDRRATLKVFLLRNETKTLRTVNYFKLQPKRSDGHYYSSDYNSDDNPKAGDLVAVYIQKHKLQGERQCPLQVNMLQNISKGNQYKFCYIKEAVSMKPTLMNRNLTDRHGRGRKGY